MGFLSEASLEEALLAQFVALGYDAPRTSLSAPMASTPSAKATTRYSCVAGSSGRCPGSIPARRKRRGRMRYAS